MLVDVSVKSWICGRSCQTRWQIWHYDWLDRLSIKLFANGLLRDKNSELGDINSHLENSNFLTIPSLHLLILFFPGTTLKVQKSFFIAIARLYLPILTYLLRFVSLYLPILFFCLTILSSYLAVLSYIFIYCILYLFSQNYEKSQNCETKSWLQEKAILWHLLSYYYNSYS